MGRRICCTFFQISSEDKLKLDRMPFGLMWGGDENLDDGELETCRAEYQNRKEFARLLVLKDRSDVLLEDLRILSTILDNYLEFLREGEVDARSKYEKHRRKNSPSEALPMGLAGDLVGFQ